MSPTNPSPDELRDFVAGRVGDETAERIETFLATDPGALRLLEQTVAAAEFTEKFATVAAQASADDDGQLIRVIDKLKASDFSPLNIQEQARAVLDAPIGRGKPGRLGKFEIREVIAAGGMGLVFKAYDKVLQREVAIKALSPRLAEDAKARARFIREARAVAALDHPNILPIHAVEEGERVPFIVMPLAGRTLQDLVVESGPLPPRRAAALLAQAAEALVEAHAKGIVHRDIKPANLLLDELEENVSVADFGIAQRSDGAPEENDSSSAGTPAFAAPEQIAGGEATPQSDLYALGATLHFALTGDVPEGAKRIRGSKWLGSLLADLLQPDPSRRPNSASTVVRRLRRGSRRLTRAALLAALPIVLVAGLAALTPLGVSGWTNRLIGWTNGEHIYVEGRFGTYRSLKPAAHACAGRPVILDFNGELEVEAFSNKTSSPLTILAVSGRRPVLVQGRMSHAMIMSTGPLTLEGITLVRPPTAQQISHPMLRTVDASLTLRRCVVVVLGATSESRQPIQIYGAESDLSITDCIIHSGPAHWMFRRATAGALSTPKVVQVQISNSLIIAESATIRPEPLVTVDVELDHVTALGGRLFDFSIQHPLKIRSKNCLFEMSKTYLWMHELEGEADNNAHLYLDWRGQRNAYSSAPPADGFLRWGEHGRARRFETPEKWNTRPYAAEVNPVTIPVNAAPTTVEALPELPSNVSSWHKMNGLDHAHGADLGGLLERVLGVLPD